MKDLVNKTSKEKQMKRRTRKTRMYSETIILSEQEEKHDAVEHVEKIFVSLVSLLIVGSLFSRFLLDFLQQEKRRRKKSIYTIIRDQIHHESMCNSEKLDKIENKLTSRIFTVCVCVHGNAFPNKKRHF
jgi:hypothetical protein